MRQMGIKAHWVKPYVQTTIDSDFSQKLKNILNEEFNPAHPRNMLSGVQISLIFGHLKDFVSYQCDGSVFKKNHFLGVE